MQLLQRERESHYTRIASPEGEEKRLNFASTMIIALGSGGHSRNDRSRRVHLLLNLYARI